MKTFIRLIRRYVLTAIAVVLLFLFLGIGMIVWISWREGSRLPQQEYTASKIADSMAENKNGLSFGSAHTPQEWMDGYSWAMVCKLCLNGMPVPLLRNCYSIFNGTKYR